MDDAIFNRLVRALDTAITSEGDAALEGDLEHAALRLRCLTQRLGEAGVSESPYLSYLRRTTRRPAAAARMAASA
jgi:hypothetical protein